MDFRFFIFVCLGLDIYQGQYCENIQQYLAINDFCKKTSIIEVWKVPINMHLSN